MSAILAGILYLIIGRAFAIPTTHVQAWRLAAWIVSLLVLTAHTVYAHRRLRLLAARAALHVAAGVAIGGFLLAANAMMLDFMRGTPRTGSWLLALVLWPVFLGVPAFILGYVGATLLSRYDRSPA